MIMPARLKLLVYFADGFFVKCSNFAFHNDFLVCYEVQQNITSASLSIKCKQLFTIELYAKCLLTP